jgi:hypothetical protein
LAADDVLYPDRIQKQVEEFERLPEEYALLYTNIALVNAQGRLTGYAFQPQDHPPAGDVFACLLKNHFLPSPSTMFKTSVFFSLGGYNEALSFEDFDYWIRCARHYSFGYLDIVSTKKRILPTSFSTQFYDTQSNTMLESTFFTFLWASTQLRNREEENALVKGASYYFRQSVLLGHFSTAEKFHSLLLPSGAHFNLPTFFCLVLYRLKWNISSFYKNTILKIIS